MYPETYVHFAQQTPTFNGYMMKPSVHAVVIFILLAEIPSSSREVPTKESGWKPSPWEEKCTPNII